MIDDDNETGGVRYLSLFADLAGGLIVVADMDLAGLTSGLCWHRIWMLEWRLGIQRA